ncbi:hypothetical protein BDZ89DRAFT_1058013 [Hymenopellis radicata]|nr:hypothetical protein BDZ89DRAFT_1058013 [Hymenopellis radicata]
MDSLVTDVFDHQYLIDGKPEFGEGFCVVLEESIWLTENAVTTSEARPGALVAYGPINGTTIGEEIRFILQGTTAPDRTTAIPPPQLPSSPPPPISTSTDADPASTMPPPITRNPELANLYANVQFQHNPRVDLVDLHLIATFLEYKNPSQWHRYEQLCMDFTTAHLQRRALALDNRTLFGFALGRDGVAVYASYWSGDYQRVYVSADPVHFFSFEDNAPLQIVRLFLCLRRLAKVMTAQFEVDKQAVVSRASHIASNLHQGNTVWRSCKEEESSMPPPWSLPPAGGLPPGPSGPPHSSPSSRCDSDGPPPEKRQKTADTGNASVLPTHDAGRQANANETEQTLTDALTTQNLSGFVEYERDIERWAVHVNLESTMGGDLDQEEPCMDGEASVPVLKDAGATIEMSPEKVPPFCTAILISPPPPYLSSCPHL